MAKSIFFAWTRSFWAAVVTGLLIIDEVYSQLGDEIVLAVVTPIALAAGADPQTWAMHVSAMLPLLTLALMLQQRSGAARPYTWRLNSDTLS